MWSSFKNYIRAQFHEIESDPLLRWYGFLLSFLIPLSFLFMHGRSARIANASSLAQCWPFFPNCELHPLRGIGSAVMAGYWWISVALALFAAIHFVRGKVSYAWFTLAAAFLMKGFLQIADYSFMGNYHYMPYIVVIGFLLVPGKVQHLKLQIVLFYVFAGLLKLNYEWLSGAAIPQRISWLSEPQFQTLTFLVVILELGIVLGLFVRALPARSFALLSLAAFHVFSYQIVGYFYPGVMLCLLSIFLLEFRFQFRPFHFQNLSKLSKIALSIFILAQLVPFLSGKDPAIHTSWRLPSLNMFDAAVKCEGGIYMKRKNETIEYIPDHRASLAIRVRCDPAIFLSEARRICKENSHDPAFQNIDVFLVARRTTDKAFDVVLQERDVCRAGGRLD